MKVDYLFSKRYAVLLGFSKWFLLFSLLLRILFLIWQLTDVNLSNTQSSIVLSQMIYDIDIVLNIVKLLLWFMVMKNYTQRKEEKMVK